MGGRGGLELGVGLVEAETPEALAGAAVRADAVGDLGLLRDPLVYERRVLADDVEEFAAALEKAADAVARIRQTLCGSSARRPMTVCERRRPSRYRA